MLFIARIRGDDLLRGFADISCGVKSHNSSLIVDTSLDFVRKNRVHMRYLNVSSSPTYIARNSIIGQFKYLNHNYRLIPFDNSNDNALPAKSPLTF